MHWIPVGASLFASNIGSGHFIGLAGSAAAKGLGVGLFEVTAVFILVLLGWIFTPVYLAAKVFTMPEYLSKRFGGKRIRVYLSSLTLLLYVVTKISADLYAGAIFIDQALNISLYPAMILLLSISALFTIMGGLTAVIWTDAAQTVIMLVGASYLSGLSLVKVGGQDAMFQAFFDSIPNTSHVFYGPSYDASSLPEVKLKPPDYFVASANRFDNGSLLKYSECSLPLPTSLDLIKPVTDADLPFTGVLFGLTINSIWYWCSDQVIVQRVLSAKNFSHAKGGCLMAGLLKLLPLFLLVYPGMVARILFPDEVACGTPEVCQAVCGKSLGCSDVAYAKLVLSLLPSGARGLMLAVMVASLVSSLTSIFNSASVIFTLDIWKQHRGRASDAELLIVGRITVLVLVGVGIAWVPIVRLSDELFHYIQSLTAYLAPPICAVYVLAIFWRRFNEPGAFWALVVGLVCGLIRFCAEVAYPRVGCGDSSTLPSVIANVHYLHFAVLLFIISALVGWAVSINTTPPAEHHVYRKLYWNTHLPYREEMDPSTARQTGPVPDTAHQFTDAGPKPWYVRAAFWICGLEDLLKPKSQEQVQAPAPELENVDSETTRMRTALDAIALMVTASVVFIIAYFY